MTKKPIIFIGYDARESLAAGVCAYSILRRASERACIYMLEHRMLRRLKLFDRPWRIDSTGQFYDHRDRRPFSTEFSHSRFLVFELARRLQASGPCMFVDCDWLFLGDVMRLLDEQAKHPDKIGVVKRYQEVQDGSTKMDGMQQTAYARKLWSALFTFMPSPHLAQRFSPLTVNTTNGRDLHSFRNRDAEQFWAIDPRWHYVPSLDGKETNPLGIHFSEFSPWINPELHETYPDEYGKWHEECADYLDHASNNGTLRLWDNLERDLRAVAFG